MLYPLSYEGEGGGARSPARNWQLSRELGI